MGSMLCNGERERGTLMNCGITLNLYAGGGLFGQYKMMQKTGKLPKHWHMVTHL